MIRREDIRLIASDLDGTLLLNGAQRLPDETAGLIKKLKDMGIVFCAASGRQYPNLYRLFGEAADDIAYICENGSVVIYKGRTLSVSPMDKKLGMEIIRCITDVPECEVLVSGERVSYLKPKTEAYLVRMRDIVKNDIILVDDLCDIPEDYVKISVYEADGIKNHQDYFLSAFDGKAQACVSGSMWLDFTAFNVNKGNALKTLMERLGIERKGCVAFGDNFNDVEMLQAVGCAVAMEHAHPDVKKYSDCTTDNVIKSLRRIIEEV